MPFSSPTLLLALGLAAVAPCADDAPRIRVLDVAGASAYDRETLLRIVRLRPGDPLRRDAAAVAAALETRYHNDGYVAARVEGTWDAGLGRLVLAVDEGRLSAVAVEGVTGRAAERALEVSGLEAGGILREADVATALDRIERASGRALEPAADDSWTLAPGPEGSRLTLRVASPPARARLSLRKPDGMPIYDRIDGFAPWLGVEALIHDRVSYNHLSLYGRTSYGFASEDLRFALGARRPFGTGGRLTLGYEFHDLTDSDDLFRGPGLQEALRTLLLRSSFRDYFRRRGHEAYAFGCLSPRAHLGLSWRSDSYQSLTAQADGSLFRKSRAPRPNPPVDPGRMRSLVATLRWSSREPLFDDPVVERESFLARSLYRTTLEPLAGVRVEGSFEWASPRRLGSDFEFRRSLASLRTAYRLGGPIELSTRVLLGVNGGRPPAQRRFALGGRGALPGYDFKEFSGGNHLALASVEWTYHMPSPWPAPAAFYDGGAVWGGAGPGSGFRSDVGIGLKWPGQGRVVVRADLAFALGQRRPAALMGVQTGF